ncbi:MAG: hypothetical protein BWY78_00646 [Alphaproteobacteria bacterium ADurb.Bin438]|nr:MAG: hypothetical protein BWY78_00646 [Alphaproteobacteria bacterium ADurb.Bin438]
MEEVIKTVLGNVPLMACFLVYIHKMDLRVSRTEWRLDVLEKEAKDFKK